MEDILRQCFHYNFICKFALRAHMYTCTNVAVCKKNIWI